MRDLVYVAWGWQGETFTVHRSPEGARAAVIAEAIEVGAVVNEQHFAEAEANFDLDGFTVEDFELLP